jgi:hypothetical protein
MTKNIEERNPEMLLPGLQKPGLHHPVLTTVFPYLHFFHLAHKTHDDIQIYPNCFYLETSFSMSR